MENPISPLQPCSSSSSDNQQQRPQKPANKQPISSYLAAPKQTPTKAKPLFWVQLLNNLPGHPGRTWRTNRTLTAFVQTKVANDWETFDIVYDLTLFCLPVMWLPLTNPSDTGCCSLLIYDCLFFGKIRTWSSILFWRLPKLNLMYFSSSMSPTSECTICIKWLNKPQLNFNTLTSGTKISSLVRCPYLYLWSSSWVSFQFLYLYPENNNKLPYVGILWHSLCTELWNRTRSLAAPSPWKTMHRDLKVPELNSGSILKCHKTRDHWTVPLLLNHCLYLHTYSTFTIWELLGSNIFFDMCCWFLGQFNLVKESPSICISFNLNENFYSESSLPRHPRQVRNKK